MFDANLRTGRGLGWGRVMSLLGGLWLLVAAPTDGRVINWSSEFFGVNVDSSGAALGEEFFFELGYFAGGFVPQPENANEWHGYWQVLGATRYDAGKRVFLAETEVTGSALRDQQAYIWGYNRRDGLGREWVLITSAQWRLPQGEAAQPSLPLNWSLHDAAEAVIGSINSSSIHFQTAPVPIDPVTWTQWQQEFLRSSGRRSHWAADADGDGLSNGLEFAFGSNPADPRSCAWPAIEWRLEDDQRQIILHLSRNARALLAFRLEISSDLISWQPAGSAFEHLSADAGASSVILRSPYLASPAWFVRVSIPEEQFD